MCVCMYRCLCICMYMKICMYINAIRSACGELTQVCAYRRWRVYVRCCLESQATKQVGWQSGVGALEWKDVCGELLNVLTLQI